MSSFDQSVQRAAAHLEQASHQLAILGLHRELEPLCADFARTEFRVSILGRFKRGKSSVINALLGRPVVPTDTLPCTSALIEIRRGEDLRVWNEGGGARRPATLDELRREAGKAGKGETDTTDERWSVELPSTWMPRGFVLVDTPGTDEDDGRQERARSELLRADAAIVVLWAGQAAHATDLDLIADLRQRVSLVIVVVNGMDTIPSDQHERVLGFVRRRLAEVGIESPRVTGLSAEQSLHGNQAALIQLEALRGLISEVLLSNAAGARLAAMESKLGALLRTLEPRIAEALAGMERGSAQASKELKKAEALLDNAHVDRDRVGKIIEKHGDASGRTAREQLAGDWDGLVDLALGKRGRWKSDFDPLLSPKRFALDIGDQAKAALEQTIRDYTAEELTPGINDHLAQARREIGKVVAGAVAAAAQGGLGAADDLLAKLESEALSSAFGKALRKSSDNSVEAAVAAAASVAVGYIVADIVLFYVMGAISGFLAPPLLLAAAGTGVAAYMFKGRAWVQNWIRDKIANTLSEELKAEKTRRKIAAGVASAIEEIFEKLQKGYAEQLARVEKRARQGLETNRKKAAEAAEASAKAYRAADDARRHLIAIQRELVGPAAASRRA